MLNAKDAQVEVAGANSIGSLSGESLEMSNVDMAAEKTNLFSAQCCF